MASADECNVGGVSSDVVIATVGTAARDDADEADAKDRLEPAPERAAACARSTKLAIDKHGEMLGLSLPASFLLLS